MTTSRKTWPEVFAYVVGSRTRTDNAVALLRPFLVAFVVVAAMAVAITALALDKASPAQLGLGGGGLAVAAAAVSAVKRWLTSRRSSALEEAVGEEAGDQDDHRADGDTAQSKKRDEKKDQSGGKDARAAVVERGEQPGRRANRRATPR